MEKIFDMLCCDFPGPVITVTPRSTQRLTFAHGEAVEVCDKLDRKGHCYMTIVGDECRCWASVRPPVVVDSEIGLVKIASVVYMQDALHDHPHYDQIRKNPLWADDLAGRPGMCITLTRV